MLAMSRQERRALQHSEAVPVMSSDERLSLREGREESRMLVYRLGKEGLLIWGVCVEVAPGGAQIE